MDNSLRNRAALRYYQVQRVLLENNLLPATRDYARFIILGRSRSGTTMLRTALTSHTQTVALGELFNQPGKMRWQPRFGREQHPLAGPEAWTYVQQNVFRTYPAGTRAVGFKIFHYHAREDGWETIWDGLHADKELRILHVKRRNLLEVHLSREIAARRDRWSVTGSADAPPPQTPLTIALDFDACRADFELTRDYYNDLDAFFAGHPLLEITYEDMVDDFTAQSRRVQSFLGLDYADISPQTRKQARRPLQERISNYDDLQNAFAGSAWAEFFVE